jgi:hypothetical protein
MPRKSPLSIEQIMHWAREHHRRTGSWPNARSGAIPGVDLTWKKVNSALKIGYRGLPGRMSIIRVLRSQGIEPDPAAKLPLSIEQIVHWAREHHARTGKWPRATSGRVPGTSFQWKTINHALYHGSRGLPGRLTIVKVLRLHGIWMGKRPPLSIDQIFEWAKAHHARTGRWPSEWSGRIPGTGTNWNAVAWAFRRGGRGLPRGLSIREVLRMHGIVVRPPKPPLTIEQILVWADEYHQRTGRWPGRTSGTIPNTDASWPNVESALKQGYRGLPGGLSLHQLLKRHRGASRRLSVDQIVEWARRHHDRTGRWPNNISEPVFEAPHEDWGRIAAAMAAGVRGLPKRTLTRVLVERCGMRSSRYAKLTARLIGKWAKLHHQRTGRWPTVRSGPIIDAPGENWWAVQGALYTGARGLAPGGSLARLLKDHLGVVNRRGRPKANASRTKRANEASRSRRKRRD